MHVSAKTEYACLAVLDLALHDDGAQPVRVAAIAERQSIPPRFLVQILLQLKSAGLVTSVRGAAGGYQLARPSSGITVWQVIRHFEKDSVSETRVSGQTTVDTVHSVWNEVAAQERELLDALTFADLASRVSAAADNMYYI